MKRTIITLVLLAPLSAQQSAGHPTTPPPSGAQGYDQTQLYIPPGSYVPPLPWVPPMLWAHLQPAPPTPVAQPLPPSATER